MKLDVLLPSNTQSPNHWLLNQYKPQTVFPHILRPRPNLFGGKGACLYYAMTATLQLSSHFVTKIHPLFSTPSSSFRRILPTYPRTFSPKMSSSLSSRNSSLAFVAPLEAILFDIDGTLCDSDPIHYYAFREMLQEAGFNGGEPISEEFFIKNISGMHNEELCHVLFPDWDMEKARKFMDDKEEMFRRLASEQLKPVNGLDMLCKWINNQGVRRAAVTNAPRPNAELIISLLGLGDFFELLIIGSECKRAKPFPDPYLMALEELGVFSDHAFVFEDSTSGIKAGVAAGMPVVGLSLRNPEKLLSEVGATIVIKDFADSKLWTELESLVKKIDAVKASL